MSSIRSTSSRALNPTFTSIHTVTAANSTTSTIPITTTITAASSTCVATLQGQAYAGTTALIYNSDGGFITLNNTCYSSTVTPTGTATIQTQTVVVVPSASASQDKKSSEHDRSLPAGTVAGLVIAVIAVLVALIGAGAWIWYRRRSRAAVVDMPAKTFDEDASNEICFRWEKDGSERCEKDGSERCETDGSPVTEMLAEPAPVEIGDARSIRKSIRLSVDVQEPVSPAEARQSETSVIERHSIVSPLSPHSPHWQSLS